MKLTSFYPVLMSPEVERTAAFYTSHFGFRPLFAADWYVHLQSGQDPAVNLAILDGNHVTIPARYCSRADGFLLNFEVDDAYADHTRLSQACLPFLQLLRD